LNHQSFDLVICAYIVLAYAVLDYCIQVIIDLKFRRRRCKNCFLY